MPASRISLSAVRRALYQRGLSAQPTCPKCGAATDPKAFTKQGICTLCDVAFRAAEVDAADARIRAIDAELLRLWAANRDAPSEALDSAMHSLECERWELVAITHPEEMNAPVEEGPDGNPVLPERHPPMLDGDTGPFLPTDGDE